MWSGLLPEFVRGRVSSKGDRVFVSKTPTTKSVIANAGIVALLNGDCKPAGTLRRKHAGQAPRKYFRANRGRCADRAGMQDRPAYVDSASSLMYPPFH